MLPLMRSINVIPCHTVVAVVYHAIYICILTALRFTECPRSTLACWSTSRKRGAAPGLVCYVLA
jgi:uncharacterized membrane protein